MCICLYQGPLINWLEVKSTELTLHSGMLSKYDNVSSGLDKLNEDWLEKTPPVKLTECRRLRVNSVGWGALSDYTLESVKVNRESCGNVTSSAVLRISDRSGQISCVIKGLDVGLLFGLNREQWRSIESLTRSTKQLFYRYFQNGILDDFPIEQKMFYYFCHSCQIKNIAFVAFRRTVSTRKIDKNKAFLHILKIYRCSPRLLELYETACDSRGTTEKED